MTKTYPALVFLLCSSAAIADTTLPQCKDFSKYLVKDVFVGPHAKPNIASSPDARRFKTRILRDYTGKPDFSGHYQVVSWGCGSNCHVFALVDTKTGKITFAPSSAAFGAEYHLNSALFIIDPTSMVEEGDSTFYKTAYFVWDESLGDFRSLKECDSNAQQVAPRDAPKAARP
jgi:hypothetical protein